MAVRIVIAEAAFAFHRQVEILVPVPARLDMPVIRGDGQPEAPRHVHGEPRAFRGELVDIRRGRLVVAETREVTPAEVIDQHHHDIRGLGGGEGGAQTEDADGGDKQPAGKARRGKDPRGGGEGGGAGGDQEREASEGSGGDGSDERKVDVL